MHVPTDDFATQVFDAIKFFFGYIFQKTLTVLWVEFEGCPLLIDGLSGSGFVWHAGHALYASDEYLKNKSETC